jgi:hypothetical protein
VSQIVGNAEDDRNDPRDAANIYSTLQNDVLPSWEGKDETWANLMRESIASSAGFTGRRMIEDYLHFYKKFN